MTKELERNKWENIFKQEKIRVDYLGSESGTKDPKEILKFLLDYARIVDPTIHVSDSEIKQFANKIENDLIPFLIDELDFQIGDYKSRHKSEEEARECEECQSDIEASENLIYDLNEISKILRNPTRKQQIYGIEKFVHLAHLRESNLISQAFYRGPDLANDIQQILNLLASDKVNKYLVPPIKVPSFTQKYKEMQHRQILPGVKRL
jgi:hypothetical protein